MGRQGRQCLIWANKSRTVDPLYFIFLSRSASGSRFPFLHQRLFNERVILLLNLCSCVRVSGFGVL